MYLDTLLEKTYLSNAEPTTDEIALLTKGCHAQVDRSMLVGRKDLADVLLTYRTKEPMSEAFLSILGSKAENRFYSSLLKIPAIAKRYAALTCPLPDTSETQTSAEPLVSTANTESPEPSNTVEPIEPSNTAEPIEPTLAQERTEEEAMSTPITASNPNEQPFATLNAGESADEDSTIETVNQDSTIETVNQDSTIETVNQDSTIETVNQELEAACVRDKQLESGEDPTDLGTILDAFAPLIEEDTSLTPSNEDDADYVRQQEADVASDTVITNAIKGATEESTRNDEPAPVPVPIPSAVVECTTSIAEPTAEESNEPTAEKLQEALDDVANVMSVFAEAADEVGLQEILRSSNVEIKYLISSTQEVIPGRTSITDVLVDILLTSAYTRNSVEDLVLFYTHVCNELIAQHCLDENELLIMPITDLLFE